jgi:DNA-binding transcriptional MerR regulator
MAQDFHAAFGLNGDDETHITDVDAQGVSFAAIQELYRQNRDMNRQTQELSRQNRELWQQNAVLQKDLADLHAAVDALKTHRD